MEQNYKIDSTEAAQREMRSDYKNGATGVIVSGLVWMVTAVVIHSSSPKQAIWVLLIGGALIHPLSTLVNKLLGVTVSANKDNQLVTLALEGTVFMIMTIPIAYGLSLLRTEWFFQGMMLIIGGRYLTFHTLYGNKIFWLFGGILGLSAYVLFASHAQSFVTTLTCALIEITFGVVLFYDFSSRQKVEVARRY